jgi:hypothetical protein
MGNPYKFSNYVENNRVLVPAKLINRNIEIPAPIFGDLTDEEDKGPNGKQSKLKQFQKALIADKYKLYQNKLNDPEIHRKPVGYSDHMILLREEDRMFKESNLVMSPIHNIDSNSNSVDNRSEL